MLLRRDSSHFTHITTEAQSGRWRWGRPKLGFELWAVGPQRPCSRPPRSPAHGWCCGQRRILRSQHRSRQPGEGGGEEGRADGWGGQEDAASTASQCPSPPNRTHRHRGPAALQEHRFALPRSALGRDGHHTAAPASERDGQCAPSCCSPARSQAGWQPDPGKAEARLLGAQTLSPSTCPFFTKTPLPEGPLIGTHTLGGETGPHSHFLMGNTESGRGGWGPVRTPCPSASLVTCLWPCTLLSQIHPAPKAQLKVSPLRASAPAISPLLRRSALVSFAAVVSTAQAAEDLARKRPLGCGIKDVTLSAPGPSLSLWGACGLPGGRTTPRTSCCPLGAQTVSCSVFYTEQQAQEEEARAPWGVLCLLQRQT